MVKYIVNQMLSETNTVSSPHPGAGVREIHCKSLLNKSGITDYCVNCYAGCEHACVYCYARFATRFAHRLDPWGTFLDVKVNAVDVLSAEVRRKRPGRVFVSSVCDGWQPREENYGLTRRCLELLIKGGFQVLVLTKNRLAGRDLDILSSTDLADFGVTVTTLDPAIAGLIEPGASPPAERVALLDQARSRGVRTTHAFLGPLMPHLTDSEDNLDELLHAVADARVDYFYVDKLNCRYGVWPAIKELLSQKDPTLVEEYHKYFFNEQYRSDYSDRLLAMVRHAVRRHGLEDKLKLCF